MLGFAVGPTEGARVWAAPASDPPCMCLNAGVARTCPGPQLSDASLYMKCVPNREHDMKFIARPANRPGRSSEPAWMPSRRQGLTSVLRTVASVPGHLEAQKIDQSLGGTLTRIADFRALHSRGANC